MLTTNTCKCVNCVTEEQSPMPSPARTDELVLLSPLTVGPVNLVCMNCLKSVQVVEFLHPLVGHYCY